MIISENRPFGVIKNQLNKEDKISIVSCNTCAKMCETGGDEAVAKMKARLEEEGFTVVDTNTVTIACDMDQVKKINISGDKVLILACDAAVYAVNKKFPDKKLVSGVDTVGLGAWDEKGDITIVKRFEK